MQGKDVQFKEYVSDNLRFADLFNFYLYKGEQVIQADLLKPGSIEQIVLFSDSKNSVSTKAKKRHKKSPISVTKRRKERIQNFFTRYRDLLKFAVVKYDDKVGYLFLGIEEQSAECNYMPVRVMLYDAMTYTAQTEGNLKQSYPELEHFPAGRLIPVISLVVYLGHTHWKSAKSLHDMMPDLPETLKEYIPNYKLNLIEPLSMNETDYTRMKTHWSAVFEAFKVYIDKGQEEFYNYARYHQRMSEIEHADVRFLETMTGCTLPIAEENEVTTMNVNKLMDDYFKKHDDEVIEAAKPKIIEDAKPQIIEDAKPQIIEDAKPQIIEDAKPQIIEDARIETACRMIVSGESDQKIQEYTLLPIEKINALRAR